VFQASTTIQAKLNLVNPNIFKMPFFENEKPVVKQVKGFKGKVVAGDNLLKLVIAPINSRGWETDSCIQPLDCKQIQTQLLCENPELKKLIDTYHEECKKGLLNETKFTKQT
jgi:hypothetical protein